MGRSRDLRVDGFGFKELGFRVWGVGFTVQLLGGGVEKLALNP